MDISLHLPSFSFSSVNLKDCLKSFIEPEKMEKCGFRCEKCKAVDHFDKNMTIFRFPKILVIHMKRFQNTGRNRQKLSTSVSIPTKLDMTPYGSYSTHTSKDQASSYSLYGISHHSGTLNGGHYIG